MFRSFVSILLVTLLSTSAVAAEFRLSPVLGDHMVLQREKAVKIWGWADKGETVTARFAGQAKKVTAKEDGTWLARLDPMPPSAEGRELVVASGDLTKRFVDVLVGEVWLLGGQSNMEMPLWWRGDGKTNAEGTRLVLETDHPWLRVMSMPQRASSKPQEDFPQDVPHGEAPAGRWFVSRSRDPGISGFSALGYFIALGLHERPDLRMGAQGHALLAD